MSRWRPEDDVSIHERGLEDTLVLPGERDYLQQELELCRKERELLERECIKSTGIQDYF